ncbi:MAG: VWA domain-containing protein, partial [Myxococcales bacterium]|nr:VWA domain-containing protein [Myxococcales bacterium]
MTTTRLLRWLPLGLTGSLMLTLAVAGCTGDLGNNLGGSDACPGGVCGTCDTDGDCPSTAHCANGQCIVACSTASDCGDGFICDDRGRCVSDFNPNAGGGGSGGGPDGCADVQVTFAPVTPNVVLLIDQSGSMTSSYPGGNRWNVLHDALMDPQDGVVHTLEGTVRFGLALYTSFDGNQGGTCPVLTEVSLALGNHAAIDAVYSGAQPEDETPTGESLEQVATALVGLAEDGPKIIILATDGEPDTCAEP